MFSKENWEITRENYTKWWKGELKRPIIKATIQNKVNSSIELLSQKNCNDLKLSAEDIINRIDIELKNQEYLGDAFPYVNFDSFGPGVVAAFCGAILDNSTGNVWFEVENKLSIKDLHIEYDRNNIWLNRIKDIYNAGLKKWDGSVLMGMPDLGGVLDILAVFRGTDNFLIDLYDEPDEVKRLAKEIQEIWFKVYNELNEVLQPINPGYTDWSGIYSDKPSYIIQCDFSYMISPDMFLEFVLDDLKEMTEVISNTIYHMDGQGEIPHLKHILALEKLKAVQWVPGDGAPPSREWIEIFREIRKANKNMQVIGSFEDFREVANCIGAEGIYFQSYDINNYTNEEIKKFLNEYGLGEF